MHEVRRLRPCPHASVLFENATFFSVSKKNPVHTWRFRIVFARPHENAKNANTAERACVFTMPVYLFDLRALFEYVAVWKTG